MSERPSGPRCAALVGPYLSGKTTLLEALLFAAGAINRRGTQKDGNTVGDHTPDKFAVPRRFSGGDCGGALARGEPAFPNNSADRRQYRQRCQAEVSSKPHERMAPTQTLRR